MWPINYDDPNKFHISVGIGLIFAGFLLYLTTVWSIYNSIDKLLTEDIDVNQPLSEILDTKFEFLSMITNQISFIYKLIAYLGLFIFAIGYIPWVRGHKNFRESIEKTISKLKKK
ncbi:hypothetical protein HYX15_01975 [Candidatus Woesearchaeota archaeon]|nr:hypothetical protein [Candidatus Woesearchaeota archaeon]